MISYIYVNDPIDLDLTVRLDQGHRWRSDTNYDGWYTSVLGGDAVWIRQEPDLNAPIQVFTDADPLRMAELVKRQFRTHDDDVEVLAALYNRNQPMKALIARAPGVRLMRTDTWECTIFFILNVRSHDGKTRERMDAIAAALSDGAPLANGLHPFPRPADIATPRSKSALSQLDLGLAAKNRYVYEAADLMRETVWNQRLESIIPERHWGSFSAVLAHMASDHDDEALIRRIAQRDAVSALRRIPGVGAYSAHCISLFGMGYLSAFPADVVTLYRLADAFLDRDLAGYAYVLLNAGRGQFGQRQEDDGLRW